MKCALRDGNALKGVESVTDAVGAVESDMDQESKNLVHGATITSGFEIYVYDVSFDLHIQNISGAGGEAAIEEMYEADMLLF